MGKLATPLTDKKIQNIKPTNKEQVLSDGSGLQLRITPNGTKTWHLVYKSPTTGKRVALTLGVLKPLSLANARRKARAYRELIAQDVDPRNYLKEEKQKHEAIHVHTLYNVCTD
ncbi:Arm DNA-binding domain-containing protein [Vibrio aestuarianus]|uniref:Arm DNA-binding domain-containing protein n=1 Tax=Vibrio aestuarianus TaxID=28171 RepID=UPI00237CFF23|nr:Arm DNA-binding domain-containing protein [Vibrio aestuarianus]MDE1209474.1 Arm DNA-binding domain-containing protein [Vibrio aestuarianus]MDE1253126.1 Arm DNA-binding domain-containing protein [Vibrio aestuarianus]